MLIVDLNQEDYDWVKTNAFDFPTVETLEQFREVIGNQPLSSFADAQWLNVAPPEIRDAILESVEKGRFASRSEAGRYAANIRWQNNQKGEDDPKKRAENLVKRAEGLSDKWNALVSDDPLSGMMQTEKVTVPLLSTLLNGEPQRIWQADGSLVATTVEETVFKPELMAFHDELVAFGADVEAEVMRRLGDDVEAEIEAERKTLLDQITELRLQDTDLFLLRQMFYASSAWRVANDAPLTAMLERHLTPEQTQFFKENLSSLLWAGSSKDKAIRKEMISLLRKHFGANKDGYNTKNIQKIASLERQLANVSVETVMRNETMKLLGEMVPMGGQAVEISNSGELVRQFKTDVEATFPDALIKLTNLGNNLSDAGGLTIRKVPSGGSYSPTDRVIKTSGEKGTNVHEFMHNLCDTNSFFRFAEQATLDSRRFGYEKADSLTPFAERLSRGVQQPTSMIGFWAPAGTYYTDDFADPYSGRVYGWGSRETLTKGLEALTTGTPKDIGLWRATAGALLVGAINVQNRMRKGRFASRSEAGRYAANIRWQNNQKGEDDPVKRAEALRKRATELAGRWEQVKDLTEVAGSTYSVDEYLELTDRLFKKVNVRVEALSAEDEPTGRMITTTLYNPEMMRLMDDIVAFGKDIQTEVQRRIDEAYPNRTERIAELAREMEQLQIEMRTNRRFAERIQVGDVSALAEDGNTAELWKQLTDEEKNLVRELGALKEERRGLDSITDRDKLWVEKNGPELEDRVDAILKDKFGLTSWGSNDELSSKLQTATKEYYEIANPFMVARPFLLDVVGQMVDMGVTDVDAKGTTKANRATFNEHVKQFFPSVLIEQVNEFNTKNGGLMLRKKTAGGSYSVYETTIRTSFHEGSNIHEFAHNLTYAMPFFRYAEQSFLQRRVFGKTTDSRTSTPFSERVKVGWQPTSKTAREGYRDGPYYWDDFTDTYAGKVYSVGARETLTRGMEHLAGSYGSGVDRLPDWDIWSFTAGSLIVGALTTGGVKKARFASRSEAGRYAANVRWQGHIRNDVTESIFQKVKANQGLTVKLLTGDEPVRGFVVAQREHTRIVKQEAFFDPEQGKAILVQYLKDKRDQLTGEQFLGLWHDKKNGEVVLDVCDNILDRDEAIKAGRDRNQQSIWDVENFEEIDTGGTGDREQFGT